MRRKEERMDFSIPVELQNEVNRFKTFLKERMTPDLSQWYEQREVPRSFHQAMGAEGWYNFYLKDGVLTRRPILRSVLLGAEIAFLSPGVAVATLAHSDLGMMGLWLFGSDTLKEKYGPPAVKAQTLMCLGNTETRAGSDVANIDAKAEKAPGGWRITGTKAYVTGGHIADMAIITAVSDPDRERTKRMSMFLVDLRAPGVTRKKLNKQVWIPSDLTRVKMEDVFVPDDHLLGVRGEGMKQVLTIFTHSRVGIAALTLGTAAGAFELALEHAQKRDIFGRKIVDFQAKAFEIADLYAKIEASRLMLYKAVWTAEQGRDFRMEASLAKYLSVGVAREVAVWAADLFGAASVMLEHPVHKFPMDVWASSLGEGTQDVQKLVIFRELMRTRAEAND